MASEQLLPCPFCGGANIISCDPLPNGSSDFYYCDDCGGGAAWRKNRKAARMAWNARTPNVERLERVNKALVEALSYMVAQFSASGETHSDEETLDEARAALKQAEEANRG